MADESQYSSGADTAPTNKRKYDDQTPPPSPPRTRTTGFSSPPRTRTTGFSSPITSRSPPLPPAYNSVPPPVDEIQLAKQKAQEIAARLLSNAGADMKRPRTENGSNTGFDSYESKGYSSSPADGKSMTSNSGASAIPVSYGGGYNSGGGGYNSGGGGYNSGGGGGYNSGGGSSKKIEVPNGRVGVIIGKAGDTIKYLQLQSGAKIQVTRDMDADPNSATRAVELMGAPDQIAKAEQLINDVLAEAEAGGSGTVSRRFSGQGGSEHVILRVPNNKVGLVIGKGGETIKNMQARTGARIQVIPLHLPPNDPATERTVHIEGTSEQIEAAKQLVNEVISENRARNQSMGGGYSQQGYQARPPSNWSQPGGPQMQQPGYGYMQHGGYPAPSPQYGQPPYGGYPPQQTSGGYPSGWDNSGNQQTGQGYDYYGQPPSQQQPAAGAGSGGGGAAAAAPAPAPADNSGYYGQAPVSGYGQQGQGYGQDGYGGYPGYAQQPPYDQQQGYGSAPTYGGAANPTQEGQTPSYGAQGESGQAQTQPSAAGQPGYSTGQQPSPNPANYPTQGTTQPGYGVPPTSQAGYGTQPPAQYGSSYGTPQAQKPPANPPAYGQTQQSPSTPGSYAQPAAQPGYPQSQPPPSGYGQPDSGAQRPPASAYGATAAQPGYGAPPPYGAPPAAGQAAGYGQAPPPQNTSYGGSGGGY